MEVVKVVVVVVVVVVAVAARTCATVARSRAKREAAWAARIVSNAPSSLHRSRIRRRLCGCDWWSSAIARTTAGGWSSQSRVRRAVEPGESEARNIGKSCSRRSRWRGVSEGEPAGAI